MLWCLGDLEEYNTGLSTVSLSLSQNVMDPRPVGMICRKLLENRSGPKPVILN
jgi:hypothetical protein